jgi:pSer/pThr/pTyr-binding forkhead associated (FHA) protein
MIGRSTHNDLVIDSRFISRYHVLLTRQNNEVVLMDLNSRNGIYVNSMRVMQGVLRPNDIISIGNYRVKYLATALSAGEEIHSPQQLAETVVMRSLDELQMPPDKDATGILSVLKK